jgi:hypothetical protein
MLLDGVVCVIPSAVDSESRLRRLKKTTKIGIGMSNKRYLYSLSRDVGSRDADDF